MLDIRGGTRVLACEYLLCSIQHWDNFHSLKPINVGYGTCKHKKCSTDCVIDLSVLYFRAGTQNISHFIIETEHHFVMIGKQNCIYRMS